jgi:hypothetical protein
MQTEHKPNILATYGVCDSDPAGVHLTQFRQLFQDLFNAHRAGFTINDSTGARASGYLSRRPSQFKWPGVGLIERASMSTRFKLMRHNRISSGAFGRQRFSECCRASEPCNPATLQHCHQGRWIQTHD